MSYGDTTHPDRLTSFDGTTIPYNAYGYPTARNGYTLSWENGRLSSARKGTKQTGQHTYSYSYNALGQRIRKSYSYLNMSTGIQPTYQDMTRSSNTTYSYDNSGRLINEYTVDTYMDWSTGTSEITYLYDASGVIGFIELYNGASTTYYYNRNLQGDVTEIYDTNGTLKASYRYDAFGNCTIVTDSYSVGSRNPIRYRGYYFDKETEFYCLGARYYCPEWRRFVSPDDTTYIDPESVNGLNLYCYCNNDPVNFVDPTGHSWESFWNSTEGKILGSILVIGGMIALTVATAGVGTAVVGALGGGFWAAVACGAVGAGALTSTSIDTIESYAYGEDLSWEQATLDFGANFAVSAVSGYLGGKIIPINSGWFKPQKFVSVFTKPYGQKLISQSAIDAVVSGIVNYFKKIDWIKFLKFTLSPKII